MSQIVIQAQKISKRYLLGEREQYQALRDSLANMLAAPWRSLRTLGRHPDPLNKQTGISSSELWALRDVSFEVRQGEILGVIGRNGAGKSTLLKILSRITRPTRGVARLRGRVGSLLEVGTGFHPELTGRENVYLNGAVLGMGKAEIQRKFDEIVAFAEVEEFIDTPVKRYSSGMYLRLAFSVAAHLETEIMLVDEVLAVGDAGFQKKCLGKMGNAARKGRTVLYVSHNLVSVQDLCQRVLWVDRGRIVEEGEPKGVISNYLKTSFSNLTEKVWDDLERAPGDSEARLMRVCVRPANGSPSDPLTVHSPLVIEIEYWNKHPNNYLHPTFNLYNEQGILLCNTGPVYNPDWREYTFPAGLIRSRCHIPGDLLNNGVHRVALHLAKNDITLLREEDLLVFEIQDAVEKRDGWYGKWAGAIRPMFEWDVELVSAPEEL